jgi:hypothetical protein
VNVAEESEGEIYRREPENEVEREIDYECW